MHHPTDRLAHTTAFVTPVVEHWLEREIAQWVHPMKDRSDDPSHHERTLIPRRYISLPICQQETHEVLVNSPSSHSNMISESEQHTVTNIILNSNSVEGVVIQQRKAFSLKVQPGIEAATWTLVM